MIEVLRKMRGKFGRSGEMLEGEPMTWASEKFRCAHGPPDITAVCFTAEKNASLGLDPVS